MPNENGNLTPKRAAQVLVYEWLLGSCNSPYAMDSDEMTEKLEDYGYRVTEHRRGQILEQVNKIVNPVRDKLSEKIQAFAHI